MVRHEDFRADGYVSLWLGNLASEDELDDYLSPGGGFGRDFGFEIHPPAGPEYDISEAGPVPVGELLEGFSGWRSFAEAAAERAEASGWTEATTAVVFYGLAYDPGFVAPEASGSLVFVGAVPQGDTG